MQWQPNDTLRPTPAAVRKPGQPHTWPFREALRAWVSPNSASPASTPAEHDASAPDPAEPPQADEVSI